MPEIGDPNTNRDDGNYFPPEPEEVFCPECENEMYWEECYECGGDGMIEDPCNDMYLIEPEYERCELCEGKGGWYICYNLKNHKK